MMASARDSRLFLPWVMLAVGCAALMWFVPGEETVPYHVAWIGVALAYGIEPWPWRRTMWSLFVYTVVTGGILVIRASEGVIGWGETAEIPLMATLMLIVVHNVRTRHTAHARLARVAWRERWRAERRERISRMTSHEMRTPATIAIGYVEMLIAREHDRQRREDLEVVRDELTRLVLVGGRLIRAIEMHDQEPLGLHDLSALLQETADRWSVVADRIWTVSCPEIRHLCAAARMRSCLDTLVENALRYTQPGDRIRILAQLDSGHLLIGVADSGRGMPMELLDAIARGDFQVGQSEFTAKDPHAQTGFGLALVQDAAEFRGGRLVAGRSREGGALVLMAIPVTRRRHGSTPAEIHRVRRSFAPPGGSPVP
jgi:signal transduction histidine kinase